MPPESTAKRLQRILVLVPWVVARKGASIDEVCEKFDLTPSQLTDDLQLLSFCGLPPFDPGTLIDAQIAGDRVSIRMAEHLAKPPRLTRNEARALVIMGTSLAGQGGGPLTRAIEKLKAAIAPGEAEAAEALAERVTVGLSDPPMLAAVREAAQERQRLRIDYYAASRREMTERLIDPLAVYGAGGHWYVGAQDHASGERRTFRVDRIRSAEPTEERFEADDAGAESFRDVPAYTPSADDITVELELTPEARWLAEYVVPTQTQERHDGGMRVQLRTTEYGWLVQLLLQAWPGVRIRRPADLAERLREEARAALALY